MPTTRPRAPATHIAPPGITARGTPAQQWNLEREELSDGGGGGGRYSLGAPTPSTTAAAAAAGDWRSGTGVSKGNGNGHGHDDDGSGYTPVSRGVGKQKAQNGSAGDTVVCAETGAGFETAEGSDENSTNVYEPLDPSLAVDTALLYRNLVLFIWLKAIGSYDSGAFSAAIGATEGIGASWGLSYIQQGTLASSVFLGNIIGCPLAGQLFSQYSEKHVLNLSLVVHTIFTFLFATFPSYYIALVNRFFIGLSLAFMVVYTPVWVDEFAPKDRQSVWMASHNSGVPLGIMMGYLTAFFFPSYTSVGWEWSFYVKCVLMLPTIAYVAKVDSRSINAQSRRKGSGANGKNSSSNRNEPVTAGSAGVAAVSTTTTTVVGGGVEASNGSSGGGAASEVLGGGDAGARRWTDVLRSKVVMLWAVTRPLVANPVYMCSVLAMSSLYFVATGLQNYVTEYLLNEPFKASAHTIMAGFGASVVSAPVCGVIAGGILLDRFGGYKGNLLRVACFTLAWGTLAAIFAVICIFVNTTLTFLLVMSVVLFCGGAIIPPGAGLTMSSLPDHLRPFGAAFSQFLYNTLGNFSGPLVCSFVAQRTGQLRYGVMTLLLSSGLGLIPMTIILIIALQRSKAGGTGAEGGGGGGGGGGLHGNAYAITIEADGEDDTDNEQEMEEMDFGAEEEADERGYRRRAMDIRPMSSGMPSKALATEAGEAMAEESIMNLHRRMKETGVRRSVSRRSGSGDIAVDLSDNEEEEGTGEGHGEEEMLPLSSRHSRQQQQQRCLSPVAKLPSPTHAPIVQSTNIAPPSPLGEDVAGNSGAGHVAGRGEEEKLSPAFLARATGRTVDTPGVTATDTSAAADEPHGRSHGSRSLASSLMEENIGGDRIRGDRLGRLANEEEVLNGAACAGRGAARDEVDRHSIRVMHPSVSSQRISPSSVLTSPSNLTCDNSASHMGSASAPSPSLAAAVAATAPRLVQTPSASLTPSKVSPSRQQQPAQSAVNARQHHQRLLKEQRAQSLSTALTDSKARHVPPTVCPSNVSVSAASTHRTNRQSQWEEEEEILGWEADASAIPNQHSFGLDFVRMWLYGQSREPARGTVPRANSSDNNSKGQATATAATSSPANPCLSVPPPSA